MNIFLVYTGYIQVEYRLYWGCIDTYVQCVVCMYAPMSKQLCCSLNSFNIAHIQHPTTGHSQDVALCLHYSFHGASDISPKQTGPLRPWTPPDPPAALLVPGHAHPWIWPRIWPAHWACLRIWYWCRCPCSMEVSVTLYLCVSLSLCPCISVSLSVSVICWRLHSDNEL